MVRDLRVHPLMACWRHHQSVFLLYYPSLVYKGLTVFIIGFICRTDIHIRDDQGVQTAYCALCSYDQENHHCWLKSLLLWASDQFRTDHGHYCRLYCYPLLICQLNIKKRIKLYHSKQYSTIKSIDELSHRNITQLTTLHGLKST